MIIDLEPIFNVEGRQSDFDYEIDMSAEELDGCFPFRKPVKVEGCIYNSTGIVEIDADAFFELDIPCTRCAKPIVQEMSTEIYHTLVRQVENENNDEYIVVENLQFDIDPLVREDIFLSLPYKFLCSEDCKGICPECGKNLNEGPCSCKPKTDPRLDALRQLLDNNS